MVNTYGKIDTTDNSAIYNSNCKTDKATCCNTTIYKPSNPQYGVQGAVSNSARLDRVKYNSINKTNNTLAKQYNVNFAYNGSNNSIYFEKNKGKLCKLLLQKSFTNAKLII